MLISGQLRQVRCRVGAVRCPRIAPVCDLLLTRLDGPGIEGDDRKAADKQDPGNILPPRAHPPLDWPLVRAAVDVPACGQFRFGFPAQLSSCRKRLPLMEIAIRSRRHDRGFMADDTIINTPDGPMTWAEWKKKNPVQIPSRRTKGKKLPNKIKLRTDET